ncbi:hypothetical protein BABINDRAFT_74213 [Babjeviella inositovora NRRL Y-12698]|uniref:Uncharacterized protein n=1 Tax=Babjeviella inositovora NRRL Y-12698 TaxID=984486 RepID=A0A1E3QZW5_9ASCO|nr:uncharacterized protein BABINDRAFT_74213 [Babjeviella inositovora NRRL Y-12698]ODQ82627.1 hypothetical protein BABINDRAFT_74213 [Babjeviella inositovora NRRL Y-12698]
MDRGVIVPLANTSGVNLIPACRNRAMNDRRSVPRRGGEKVRCVANSESEPAGVSRFYYSGKNLLCSYQNI